MELRSAKGVFNDINYNIINKTKDVMDKKSLLYESQICIE